MLKSIKAKFIFLFALVFSVSFPLIFMTIAEFSHAEKEEQFLHIYEKIIELNHKIQFEKNFSSDQSVDLIINQLNDLEISFDLLKYNKRLDLLKDLVLKYKSKNIGHKFLLKSYTEVTKLYQDHLKHTNYENLRAMYFTVASIFAVIIILLVSLIIFYKNLFKQSDYIISKIKETDSDFTLIDYSRLDLELSTVLKKYVETSRSLKIPHDFYKMYQHVLDKTSIVARTDLDGNISYVNENFCKVSGYSESEILGFNHRILKSGIHSKEFYEEMWNTISAGNIWRGRVCNRTKAKSLYWVDTSIIPINDNKNNPLEYFVIRNLITDTVETENLLLASSKLSSIGELTSQLLHDIATPLSVVSMSFQTIRKNIQNLNLNDEKVLEKIDSAIERAQKANEHINKTFQGTRQILTDSQVGNKIEMTVVDPIKNTIQVLDGKFKKANIDFNMKCGGICNKHILGNSSELTQVFMNLFNNSIDAITDNEASKNNIKLISINCLGSENSDLYRVIVTDTGSGIDISKSEEIFKPLFTTKSEKQGTGLGMSICRRIMNNHNGKIYLDTENAKEGRSSTFILEFPLIKTA